MTPLAMKVANELTTPVAKRVMSDKAGVLSMIGQDMHCFDVNAIAGPVFDAMDDANIWQDVYSIMPRMFLPSPVTWIEFAIDGKRVAWVLESTDNEWFRLSLVCDQPDLYSMPVCKFRARGVLELGKRIEQVNLLTDAFGRDKKPPSILHNVATRGSMHLSDAISMAEAGLQLNELELDRDKAKLAQVISTKEALGTDGGVAFCTLALDLINTPGIVGMRQHDPHRGMAKRMAAVGSYPLRGWSEITLKHQTKFAGQVETLTGNGFHKCLHFVRSHLRHYRAGKVSVIPAHWRGDPALGIKRTRYRLAA